MPPGSDASAPSVRRLCSCRRDGSWPPCAEGARFADPGSRRLLPVGRESPVAETRARSSRSASSVRRDRVGVAMVRGSVPCPRRELSTFSACAFRIFEGSKPVCCITVSCGYEFRTTRGRGFILPWWGFPTASTGWWEFPTTVDGISCVASRSAAVSLNLSRYTVVTFSPRSSVPFSLRMMPFVSKDLSALLSVVRSRTPHPSSKVRPSCVVMPRRNWLNEMGSRSFLKPKVRRMIYRSAFSSASPSLASKRSKTTSGTGVVVGLSNPSKEKSSVFGRRAIGLTR